MSPFLDKEEAVYYLSQKERVEKIIATICEQKADVIVLQETNNCFKEKLQKALGDNYQVCIHKQFLNSDVKVMMAYKKIIDGDINIKLYDKINGGNFAYTRWIELSYKGIEIVGLHASLPGSKEDTLRIKQRTFWKRILEYIKENKDKNALLIGDFNVFEKTAFHNSPSRAFADFKKLQNRGWRVLKTDRIDDFSYCHKGQWDRQLDYALLSPTFKYSHTFKMICFEQLSDHKMLIVQL
ncbi:endonuclease/exonuclease/phosphatase family protein [Bacillus thuringiensis]|uniref:endonuclease/exonuclease/phosphatase family protein n=1 Tax=Bacillus thuringiensis TaxID=1428 RepID=UPI0030C6BBE2